MCNTHVCLYNVQVQSHVRAQQGRRRFVQKRDATQLLQHHWRAVLAQRAAHKAQAAISLQRCSVLHWAAAVQHTCTCL